MIGIIDCKTNDVDASVEDRIDIRRDGSVGLQRSTTFHTDSDEDRTFRFFKNELLGGTVHDDATLQNAPASHVNVFTGRAPGRLVVELETTVRSSSPVRLTVRSELLPPSRESPLSYDVSFDSPQAVHYSIVVVPYLAEITAPERFRCEISPSQLQARLIRTEQTGEVCLAGSYRVSGATAPVTVKCVHQEELHSTKLLDYYREKFSR